MLKDETIYAKVLLTGQESHIIFTFEPYSHPFSILNDLTVYVS